MSTSSIGIDIGGSKIRGLLLLGGKIVRVAEIKTPRTKAAFENSLRQLVRGLARGKEIANIGVGCAGIIKNGKLVRSPNISYLKNFDFRPLFPRGVKFLLQNDAQAFLRGEMGSAKRAFGITLGTGVGRAFAKNGRVEKLKRLEEPERWEKEYQKIYDKKLLAKFLGKYLANLFRPYRPAVVIFGGKVSDYPRFLPALGRELKKNGFRGKVKRSRHGEDAVALGSVR